MAEPNRYESTQEPLDEEERELIDPEHWDWERPIEGVTVGEPNITIRLTREEYMANWRHADAQGLPTDELIKRIALAAASAPAP